MRLPPNRAWKASASAGSTKHQRMASLPVVRSSAPRVTNRRAAAEVVHRVLQLAEAVGRDRDLDLVGIVLVAPREDVWRLRDFGACMRACRAPIAAVPA